MRTRSGNCHHWPLETTTLNTKNRKRMALNTKLKIIAPNVKMKKKALNINKSTKKDNAICKLQIKCRL